MKNSISFCVFKIHHNQNIEKLTSTAAEGFFFRQQCIVGQKVCQILPTKPPYFTQENT